MKYVVFDSETTIRNTGEGAIGSSSANPFHPDNFMVAYGELGLTKTGDNKRLVYRLEGEDMSPPWWLDEPGWVTVIGTNLGFDLKWVWREWPELFWAKLPTLDIWDIQQAEYLLSGQDYKFASLDEMSARRGLPLKDDKVKEYWKQGIDTTLIPKELLLDYLGSTDIENPAAIFRDQMKQLQDKPKLLALAKVKMEDLLMTTVMEIHGMQFDLEFAHRQVEALDARIEELRERIVAAAKPLFVSHYDFDPGSGDDISRAVYGGSYTIVEDVPVKDALGNQIIYKSGKKKGLGKTRKEKVKYSTKGLKLKPGIAPQLKNGLYSSEADYLSKHDHPFVKDVLEFRELEKDVSTYYRGYSKLVFPDGKLHPTYNHAATETGRQSCSAPNLQNVTKEDE